MHNKRYSQGAQLGLASLITTPEAAERLRRYYDANPQVRVYVASTRLLAAETIARLAQAGLAK